KKVPRKIKMLRKFTTSLLKIMVRPELLLSVQWLTFNVNQNSNVTLKKLKAVKTMLVVVEDSSNSHLKKSLQTQSKLRKAMTNGQSKTKLLIYGTQSLKVSKLKLILR